MAHPGPRLPDFKFALNENTTLAEIVACFIVIASVFVVLGILHVWHESITNVSAHSYIRIPKLRRSPALDAGLPAASDAHHWI